MSNIEELDGSELGTKEYWENSYENEIENYKNHGDIGEVWFDEDSQIRVINWILKDETIKMDNRIIDLGTGNGMLLVELAREGYSRLLGVDYSPNSVKLARNIANDQNLSIDFQVIDLLDSNDIKKLGKFEIAHDKGTYDAISLHPDNPKVMRETYLENVRQILVENGIFIITSCNWTEEELIESFNDKFEKFCSIPTPTFKFGGKIGNVVTSVVFKRL